MVVWRCNESTWKLHPIVVSIDLAYAFKFFFDKHTIINKKPFDREYKAKLLIQLQKKLLAITTNHTHTRTADTTITRFASTENKTTKICVPN